MRAWPKAFDFDPVLRACFISACEALEVYGVARETWHTTLDKATENYVWNTAKKLLNIK